MNLIRREMNGKCEIFLFALQTLLFPIQVIYAEYKVKTIQKAIPTKKKNGFYIIRWHLEAIIYPNNSSMGKQKYTGTFRVNDAEN